MHSRYSSATRDYDQSRIARFHKFAEQGNYKKLKEFIDKNRDIANSLLVPSRDTALIKLVYYCPRDQKDPKFQQYADSIKLLIGSDADLNALGDAGISALHFAVSLNNLEIIKILIEGNANLENADTNGETPIANAVKREFKDAFEVLFKKGANLNVSYFDVFDCKRSAINVAYNLNWITKASEHTISFKIAQGGVANGANRLQELIKGGLNPYDFNQDPEGRRTLLHLAAESKNIEALMVLVKKIDDLAIKDRDGNTVLDYLLLPTESSDLDIIIRATGTKFSALSDKTKDWQDDKSRWQEVVSQSKSLSGPERQKNLNLLFYVAIYANNFYLAAFFKEHGAEQEFYEKFLERAKFGKAATNYNLLKVMICWDGQEKWDEIDRYLISSGQIPEDDYTKYIQDLFPAIAIMAAIDAKKFPSGKAVNVFEKILARKYKHRHYLGRNDQPPEIESGVFGISNPQMSLLGDKMAKIIGEMNMFCAKAQDSIAKHTELASKEKDIFLVIIQNYEEIKSLSSWNLQKSSNLNRFFDKIGLNSSQKKDLLKILSEAKPKNLSKSTSASKLMSNLCSCFGASK